ncbi:rapid alkalinization factor-like [Phalaenopsis equestris]|uniref:rapid alkalinization factor-like n=1 Tax=Phalaenopsis equestris TaxID=78828 RepID=UPI0009E41613|nr:rapid alkalinization factor-like [Phalaenopsis equestris]
MMETMGRRRRSSSSSRISTSLFLLLLFSTSIASISAGGDHWPGWIPLQSGCRGTIADCIAGEEFDLSSESSRRILATSSYISYDALKRGSVPCSRRGASYYNCRPGGEANPYSRGCSAITRCRG